MEVAILGAGAVGRVVAMHLAKEEAVEGITVADVDLPRARAIVKEFGRKKVSASKTDAGDPAAVAKLAQGKGLVVNATVADYNLTVMEAARNAGAHYVDFVGGGPRDLFGTPEISEQLALSEAWRLANLIAVLGLGVAPGITNLIARRAHEELAELKALHIKCYGGGSVVADGYGFSPLFNPGTLMDEILCPAPVIRGGRLTHFPPLSGEEIFEFPQGLGPLKTWYIHHDEIETFPHFLDKGLTEVDFRYAIHPQVYRVFDVIQLLGLNRKDKIQVGRTKVAPRDVVLALTPKPADLAGHVRGITCIGIDVLGSKDDRRVRFFEYTWMDHEVASQRYGCTGTPYLTGTTAALFAKSLAHGQVKERGVMPPERLDPGPFFASFPSVDIPIERLPLPVED